MVFNKNIDGYENEYEFANYLNNKQVGDLDPMFLNFIEKIFNNVKLNDTIESKVDKKLKKYDLIIKINNKSKFISIKKGIKNSIHVEPISEFIHFLIENNIKKETIIEYLKYHYADGTTNGKGSNRISAKQYKEKNQNQIDLINNDINNIELIKKAIDRFVLKGNNSYIKIDALIFGVIEDFIFIKREDIYKILLSKINNYSTAVHFSNLTCQPLDRCLNHNNKYDSKRFCIQIKWYNLADDIIESMNNAC